MTGKPSNTKGSKLLAYVFTTLCSETFDVPFKGHMRGVKIWNVARDVQELSEGCASAWGGSVMLVLTIGGALYVVGVSSMAGVRGVLPHRQAKRRLCRCIHTTSIGLSSQGLCGTGRDTRGIA